MKADLGTVILWSMMAASAVAGFLIGEIAQEAKWDGELDEMWQMGYHWGWQDGCAHYYNHHGWETGDGCGPPEWEPSNATVSNQERDA